MHLDIDQIEKSFAGISSKLDELTMMFYSDLFTRHPELKPLFGNVDFVRQRSKLAAMLTLVVTNLRHMDVLVSALRSAGAKHVSYGATAESYAWTEESWLRSLEHVSGDDWDEGIARSWAGAIGLVVAEMKAGAAPDAAPSQSGATQGGDLDLLMEIAAVPSLSFHRESLFSAYIEKKKSDYAMDLARSVQQSLIPQDHPTAPGYSFSAFYEPAEQVGGDYYDWIHDGRGIYFIFGDVTGKGFPGALIMCRLAGTAKVVMAVEKDVARALTAINEHMCDRMPAGRFVTLALLHLDLQTHRFALANAGHLPPVLRKRDGTTSFLECASGLPVGIERDMSYTMEEGEMAPGDTLVLYTDGVDEAVGPGKEMYGTERLQSCVSSMTQSDDVGLQLLTDVRRFVDGYPQSDDLTILTISRSD